MKVKKVKWLGIFMVVAMLVALVPTVASVNNNGNGECEPCDLGNGVVDLIAGQNMTVGTVTVTNDDEKVCVTYALDGDALAAGWSIYETHLYIGDGEFDGVLTPSNWRLGGPYKANPIPGQFPYGDDELDGVEEWTFCISFEDLGFGICEEVYIAAHAVIKKSSPVNDTIVFESEVGTSVYGPIYEAPDASTIWGDKGSAVRTYNWMGYFRDLDDPDQILGCTTNPSQSAKWSWGFGNDFNPTYNPDIDGVIWISTAPNTEVWHVDSWRKFVQDFYVPGTPVSGSLQVNADNYYVVSNGGVIGSDSNIWNGPETYDFTPVAGANSLEFIVKNFAQGSADNFCDQLQNPNGLTFKGTVEYSYDVWEDQTAWGEGERFNEKGNWGWYFKYKICEPDPCEPYVFGILSDNLDAPRGGTIYKINLATKVETMIYEDNVAYGIGYGNALAFDSENGRLYFTTSPNNLWFLDLATDTRVDADPTNIFTNTASVTSGVFAGGHFWYIPDPVAGQGQLRKVSFNADGKVNAVTTQALLGATSDAWWGWFGDIEYADGVIYGSTTRQYFTYDIDVNQYTVHASVPDHSSAHQHLGINLQLAWGTDGKLYGHNYGTKTWWEITNPATGTATLLFTGTQHYGDISAGFCK